MGQEASDLSGQPGGLPRSPKLPRETAVQAVPKGGEGQLPSPGTFQAKPGHCPWSGSLGLAWNQTPLQEGLLFLQGQRMQAKMMVS